MDHFEMVEKLRQKANVSYEEAKAALEASDWDILDALVLLESEGKVKDGEPAHEYTTQEKSFTRQIDADRMKSDVSGGIKKLWEFAKKLFQKGNSNQFVITRRNRNQNGNSAEELIAMPITVLVILMLCFWPFSMIVLFVGLFLGARYSFRGPDIQGKVNAVINKAQDKAAAAVEIHADVDIGKEKKQETEEEKE